MTNAKKQAFLPRKKRKNSRGAPEAVFSLSYKSCFSKKSKAPAHSIFSRSGMVASKSTPYQGFSGLSRVTSMVCAV